MNKNNCDILVLTATFGSGHRSVSKAIKENINNTDPSIRVEIADIFQIISPKLYKGIYKGYEIFIKNNSSFYNYFYYKKDHYKKSQTDELILKFYLKDFAEFMIEKNPRVVISTFPFCSGFVSKFKEKYKANIASITCITDVVDNWEWIYPNTDKYFVATHDIKKRLTKKGVDEDKIVATGIPIRNQFLSNYNDKECQRTNHLNTKNEFTILLMGGGVGLLPEDIELYQWLNSLKNVTTHVVTGHNDKLFNKLNQNNTLENINVYGYTDKIYELMNMSDVLVSKAGGITVFEAISTKLPIIVYKPALGQEIENAHFIVEKDIGCITQDLESLKNKIHQFITHSEYRERLIKNIYELNDTYNLKDIPKHILDLYSYNESNTYYNKEYNIN